MQGPDRFSAGPDDEVIAYENESLESGTASPVDVILVDETHSASGVHHNDVGSDRENSIPSFATHRSTHTTVIAMNTHSKRARRPRSSASCSTAQ
jgi:hypothetical protein